MLIVVALGGNALLKRGEAMTAETQRANVNKAAAALAELIKEGHQIVITHGNGPQVGLLALQGAAYRPDGADPLDVLGAETEGMIGYMIEQELENAIDHQKPVATLLTQVVVDLADPAFQKPTKFVGPVYDKAEAERRASAANWSIAQDGDKWRRVVPSPAALEIPDLSVLKILLRNDVIVICAGGGGIPVVRRRDGSLVGVEAVIDKDAASALLAEQIDADALLLSAGQRHEPGVTLGGEPKALDERGGVDGARIERRPQVDRLPDLDPLLQLRFLKLDAHAALQGVGVAARVQATD